MIFSLEQRPSETPCVERVWRAQTVAPGVFISQAATRCELVVMRAGGQTVVTVRGPETRATPLRVEAVGAEFFGISFRTGVFLPGLRPHHLLDRRDAQLPSAGARAFWLGGSAWQLPGYDNADTFVQRLVRAGLVVSDPVVAAVLAGDRPEMSRRAVQYHFARATGLSLATISQINRAQRAAALLAQGVSILDTVHAAGYADQPHLTRALRRYVGQTPGRLARPNPSP